MVVQSAVVVFADIDGVLASSSATVLAGNLRALERLAPRVHVVLCSGRTRPEIELLSGEVGIRHPFVCEHGAAVFVPAGHFPFTLPNAVVRGRYHVVEFGRPAAFAVDVLRRTADRFGVVVRAFGEMSVDDVARACNLSLAEARLAKLREYGERFQMPEIDLESRFRFADALRHAHLRYIPLPHCDHVGAQVDVRLGVNLLRACYRRMLGSALTVGVADWLADGEVLQGVDHALVIEGPRFTAPARVPRGLRSVLTVSFETERNWAAALVDFVAPASVPVT